MTELVARPIEEEPEYGTLDKRYGMAMHTFVNQTDMAPEKMFVQSCRRLRFLRQKLIEDLAAAKKVFVYKITERNLRDDEIASIFDAMRTHGRPTLLYVRYSDAEHPNGTVEEVLPELLIAYIDRFAVSKAGLRTAPNTLSWAAICTHAYDIWSRPEKDELANDKLDAL